MPIPITAAADMDYELSIVQRRSWLAAIMVTAFGLRIYHISWGLPKYIFNDTRIHFVEPAQNAVGAGDWVLDLFVHPPFYPYLLAVATWVWSTVTGDPIAMKGEAAQVDRATIALIGRLITVFISTMAVGATYLLGKRLIDSRVGLWAAAFVALSPLQILESHRMNVDAPMMLWAILSAHQAVVALQEKRRDKLMVSFALAAFAGATKYTGLYAGTLPLWVALRFPDTGWGGRFRMIAAGGLVSLATLAVGLSPTLLNFERFTTQVYNVLYVANFFGSPGANLTGESWVFARYIYMTVVGLPFLLGWGVFVAAVAGLITLAATNRKALVLIAAGAVPFYLLQGNAETAVGRYYFPLLPFLAICAAAFVVWIRRALPRVGSVVAVLLLLYSGVLAASQTARVGGAPQAAISELIERLAKAKRTTGLSSRAAVQPKLMIGYPYWAPLKYDALSPYVRGAPTRHLVYLPRELRSPGDAIDPALALRDDRRWVESEGVDVIVATSRWENLRGRGSFFPREEQFYQNLTQGKLGFKQVAHERTTYFTQSWYEWADPSLDTLWTAGIGGYKLFVREDLLPALSMKAE